MLYECIILCCGEVFDPVRGSHPFNATDVAQHTSGELLRRPAFAAASALALKRLQGSPDWSGHQIVKLPAEYAVGVGKVQDDAHVVKIGNREQFGTFVLGTQQLT